MHDITQTRHFNQIIQKGDVLIKASKMKDKIRAEYNFFHFVPKKMQKWFVEPFDFIQESEISSYKMKRYNCIDAAKQWVNNGLNYQDFNQFIELFFEFIHERPLKKNKNQTHVNFLFVEKLHQRCNEFLASEIGQKINKLAIQLNSQYDIHWQLSRFNQLFNQYHHEFMSENLTIGHGDSCLSNILYDKNLGLFKLVDPRGSLIPSGAWMHPLYDVCKISHSILGNYDFINYEKFTIDNNARVCFANEFLLPLKQVFVDKLSHLGFNYKAVRLGEVSLFLSMLPLHGDKIDKLLAITINSYQIMQELENE